MKVKAASEAQQIALEFGIQMTYLKRVMRVQQINRLGLFIIAAVFVSLCLGAQSLSAQSPRFIVDDQQFLDQITESARDLQKAGKLVPLETLQCEVNRRYFQFAPAPLEQKKLEPPDLYDRLRESTLAVGDFYLCDSCTNWHFDAATAFVVGADGTISTSFHVIGNGEDDPPGKPDYLVAADQNGHVYPVLEILAADPDADTCLLRIAAEGLRPLPVRPSVRVGERVYCLSHPEGSMFMFTEGIVARIMRSHNVMGANEPDSVPRPTSRPTLYLNITAEFSPGSSGGPVTDAAGNVVGQVQSISSGVENDSASGTNNASAFVSGPVRFCVAAEEIIGLTKPPPRYVAPAPLAKPPGVQPDPNLSSAQIVQQMRKLLERGKDALEKLDAPVVGARLFKRFDALADAYETRFPKAPEQWEVTLLQGRAHRLRAEHKVFLYLDDPQAGLKKLLGAKSSTAAQKLEASHLSVLLAADKVGDGLRFTTWDRQLNRHLANYPSDPEIGELELKRLELAEDFAPNRLESLATKLSTNTNAEVAKAASDKLATSKPRRRPKP
jgi:serine protease Do